MSVQQTLTHTLEADGDVRPTKPLSAAEVRNFLANIPELPANARIAFFGQGDEVYKVHVHIPMGQS